VYGGEFRACDDHWPDLVAVLWAEGAWVSGCPCDACIGVLGQSTAADPL
jgi:hypothetical protein